MKKFLSFCLMAILMCFICTSITSCRDRSSKEQKFTKYELRQDSAWFNAMYDFCIKSQAPETFTDVTDAVIYQDRLQQEYGNREIYMDMPTQAIADVCCVLFRTHKRLTISDVVDEYINHKNIYDSLSENREDREETTSPIPTDTIEMFSKLNR